VARSECDPHGDRQDRRLELSVDSVPSDQSADVLVARRRDAELARAGDESTADLGVGRIRPRQPFEQFYEARIEARSRRRHDTSVRRGRAIMCVKSAPVDA
jgi:hypothetical protein